MYKVIEKNIIFIDGNNYTKPTEGSKCDFKLTNIGFVCTKDPNFELKSEETVYFHENINSRLTIGEVDYEIDKLLESAIKSMYRKEISDFSFNLKLHRDGCYIDLLINFRLELLDFINIGYIYEWPSPHKLFVAQRHKEKGVEFFTKHEFKLAFERFSKALKLVISLGDLSESNLSDCDYKICTDLKRDLYNNLALCRQNMEEENENLLNIVYLCDKALEIDPENVKALMRLVKARMKLKDYDQALNDAKRILKLEPNNSVAKNDVVTLTKIIKQQNYDSDQIVKKMFANIT